MAFYIRKSLTFGPLRFNLSKSGLGFSAGVKGFRFGTGPRGNYVHAGRSGLYYRATLPSGGSRNRHTSPLPSTDSRPANESFNEIESANAISLVDANSAGLLAELNDKHKLTRIWPFTLAVGLLVLGTGIFAVNNFMLVAGFLISVGTFPIAFWDARRKTTVLFYDLEPPALPAVESVHAAFDGLRACARIWHIEAEGRSTDLKYTSGATTTVKREAIHLVTAAPPYFKTNVPVLCIPAGRQRLYLLPDRLLVYDSRGIGAVAYEELQMEVVHAKFVESEALPKDAQVVDRTWRYVNKKGGPDRRFRDNPELPIARYEELTLRSSSGLNEKLQFSLLNVSDSFVASIQQLAEAVKIQVIAADAETDSAVIPSLSADEPAESALFSTSTETDSVAAPIPISADRKYFFFTNSAQGPFTLEELAEHYRVGNIVAETPICFADDHRWIPYSQFVGQ